MPTIQSNDFAQWAQTHQVRVERALEHALTVPGSTPEPLRTAMRYATLDGGKRVRPLLAYATGEAVGAPVNAIDAVAMAVEMIHAYSLVHDDLPCMDNDTLRRGKPTCHVAHGEARALLVGDSLQSLAFEVLAQAGDVSPQVRVDCVRVLAQAAGSAGMAGGQERDLDSTGKTLTLTELELMHRMKTGALIGAAVRMAALCGGATPDLMARLEQFSSSAGLLFQVVDDVLDYEPDADRLGKTPGKDAQQGKATFVTLMGLEQSRSRAENLEREALSALKPFGAKGERLRQLCEFIARRKH